MKTLITLCARGGSKGIPRKNIKLLNGKPLIAYSIRFAQELLKNMDAVIELSTDDGEIKSVAADWGLTTEYNRPHFLASDTAGKVDAIKDVLFYAEDYYNTNFDFVLDLDISSPLRTLQDVLEAYDLIRKRQEALTAFSVNQAVKNPYFNMVEPKADGFYELSKKQDLVTLSRQSAPQVYELNASFYFYRRMFFENNINGVITDKSLIYKMNHICFDLDHPIDFEFMEFLLINNKLPFEII